MHISICLLYTWNPFDPLTPCFDRKIPYMLDSRWSKIDVIQVHFKRATPELSPRSAGPTGSLVRALLVEFGQRGMRGRCVLAHHHVDIR